MYAYSHEDANKLLNHMLEVSLSLTHPSLPHRLLKLILKKLNMLLLNRLGEVAYLSSTVQ